MLIELILIEDIVLENIILAINWMKPPTIIINKIFPFFILKNLSINKLLHQ